MPKKKGPKAKHPRDMTTDELVSHLFHQHVVEHVKKAAHEGRKPREPKSK